MKIRPKEITRTVGILTDPTPTWMAVVDHGANQTPFNSVKRDGIAPKTSNRQKGKTMAIKNGKGAQRKSVIQRLTFSKSLFATKKKVQAYLDDNGFTDVEIEDDNDVWTVKSTDDTSKLRLGKGMNTPAKTAGVTVTVAEILGKASDPVDDEEEEDEEDEDDTEASDDDEEDEEDEEDDEDEEDETPANKSARAKAKGVAPVDTKTKAKKKLRLAAKEDEAEDEVADIVLAFPPDAEGVQKYDFWASYMSDEDSLVGVLKDGIGYDGIPPGVEEVLGAVFYSTGNVLDGDDDAATKKQKLQAIGAQFADLTYGLYEIFEKATDNATKSATAKAFMESFGTSIETGANLTSEDNVILGPVEDEVEEPAVKGKTKPVPKAKAAAAEEQEPAWAKKLRERVEASEKAAAKTLAETTKALARGQSRKSFSDAADDILEPAKKTKAETPEQRQTRIDAVKREHGGLFGHIG